MKRSYDAMSSAITEDYGAGAFQSSYAPTVGSKVLNTQCKTVRGVYRPNNRQALQDLLYQYTFRYQSLQGVNASSAGGATGFKTRGSLDLRHVFTTGGVGVFPQVVDLPIYVFRLNTPMHGYQTCYPDSSVGVPPLPLNIVRPMIGFRLTMERTSATTVPTYKWRSFTPSQSQAFSGATQYNAGSIVKTETQDLPSGHKYRFEGTRADVLFTAPTGIPSAVTIGEIQFTREEYAPPDQYYTGNFSSIENLRPNGGAWDVAVPVPPDEPDRLEASAFWSRFVNSHDGHPLRHSYEPSPKVPVFTYLKKYMKDFTPRDTTNAASTGYQHKHTHAIRSGSYIDTSLVDKSLLSVMVQDPTEDQVVSIRNTNYEAGLFPMPTQQRWLMVHSWTRAGYEASTVAFSSVVHPTFDIAISNTFCTAEVKESQAPAP